MKKGYIQIYTGNGKGKTTATLGIAMRAAGHNLNVKIVQFLKGGPTGEIYTIKKLDTVELYRVTDEDKYVWTLSKQEKADMQQKSRIMFDKIKTWFENEQVDILILDEIMAALKYEIVLMEDILLLLDARPDTVELIMTGRDAPDELMERAHLISEIKEVKHYFSDGVMARKGIEF